MMPFTGASVAIDRVNCLLNPVVEGYSQVSLPLSRLFGLVEQHTLDADTLSAASASLRQPIPFAAMLTAQLAAIPWGVSELLTSCDRATKKVVVQKHSGVFRLRPPKILAGPRFATVSFLHHHNQLKIYITTSPTTPTKKKKTAAPQTQSRKCRGARLLRGHWHGNCASSAPSGPFPTALPALLKCSKPQQQHNSSSRVPSIWTPTACCPSLKAT